jgi:hypothetical protein
MTCSLFLWSWEFPVREAKIGRNHWWSNQRCEHWKTVGNRQSPLSGSPRLAVTPVHAVLNYSFWLLEAETRIALTSVGLDAGLGFGLHSDIAFRDSLALDVLEPVRPHVAAWVLSWITREPFRRADFLETETGQCRLRSHLCAKLGETAPTWAKLLAPWAEYVAHRLLNLSSQFKSDRLQIPLTQQHRREAKVRPPFPRIEAPTLRANISETLSVVVINEQGEEEKNEEEKNKDEQEFSWCCLGRSLAGRLASGPRSRGPTPAWARAAS